MKWTEMTTLTAMRHNGRTAAEIASSLNRPVRQVHNKLHHSGLTKDGQRNALKLVSERAGDVERIAAIRGAMPTTGYALGYVLGVLRGDGTIWKDKRGGTALRLRVRDEEFADKFSACLRAICPVGVRISHAFRSFQTKASEITTPEHVYSMSARTVTFFEVTCCEPGVVGFLSIKRDELEFVADADLVRGALDGLFDSEGFFVKTRGYVGLKMTDRVLVRWIAEQLTLRGVESKVYTSKTGYLSRISVHRIEAVRRFCALVTFSIKRKEEVRQRLLEGAR